MRFSYFNQVQAVGAALVMLEARDPTLSQVVHDIRNYSAEDIRFGMRYTDAAATGEDGTSLLDLIRI